VVEKEWDVAVVASPRAAKPKEEEKNQISKHDLEFKDLLILEFYLY
jgi:hypothetical protein